MAETQTQKIIRTADEVAFASAKEADQLGFMSKCFIQATLPHSDPGDVPVWYRQNGNYTFTIQPYLSPKDGLIRNFGIPYGSIPRLILAWVNGEAVKTKSPELILGKSLSEFMEKIGIEVSGGARGGITRLKNQALRLFSARITMSYEDSKGLALTDARIAKQSFFFWNQNQPQQQSLWESRVLLSEDFYQLLINAPVPLDWRVLKALKRSPMALDLYMWLSYRIFSLEKPQRIRWDTLSSQFGSEYERVRDFRLNVRKHLLKIQAVWSALDVDVSDDTCLEIRPSRLLIARK